MRGVEHISDHPGIEQQFVNLNLFLGSNWTIKPSSWWFQPVRKPPPSHEIKDLNLSFPSMFCHRNQSSIVLASCRPRFVELRLAGKWANEDVFPKKLWWNSGTPIFMSFFLGVQYLTWVKWFGDEIVCPNINLRAHGFARQWDQRVDLFHLLQMVF